MRKRFLGVFLFLLLYLALLPNVAFATNYKWKIDVDDGDKISSVTSEGNDEGNAECYVIANPDDKEKILVNVSNYDREGNKSQRIIVNANNVTTTLMEGVRMEPSAYQSKGNGGPLVINDSFSSTLFFSPNTALGAYAAGSGIQVGEGATLTIQQSGEDSDLAVRGASRSAYTEQTEDQGFAGIGGDGIVHIKSGNVTVYGGKGAPAIATKRLQISEGATVVAFSDGTEPAIGGTPVEGTAFILNLTLPDTDDVKKASTLKVVGNNINRTITKPENYRGIGMNLPVGNYAVTTVGDSGTVYRWVPKGGDSFTLTPHMMNYGTATEVVPVTITDSGKSANWTNIDGKLITVSSEGSALSFDDAQNLLVVPSAGEVTIAAGQLPVVKTIMPLGGTVSRAGEVTHNEPSPPPKAPSKAPSIVSKPDSPRTTKVIQPKNGSVSLSPKNGKTGATVKVTPTPKDGYVLDKIVVTDKRGREVEITQGKNGVFTFAMPSGGVEVETFFKNKKSPEEIFTDINKDEPYYDDMLAVQEKGLMHGVTPTEFAPLGTLTRGMISTVLYRMEEEPAFAVKAKDMSFVDVDKNAYFNEAVYWAKDQGIVSGYSKERFGPNDPVSREQVAAILYRYAEEKGYDITVSNNRGLLAYEDGATISRWAVPAVQWALERGILESDGGDLRPNGNATRAQIAMAVNRFDEEIAKK